MIAEPTQPSSKINTVVYDGKNVTTSNLPQDFDNVLNDGRPDVSIGLVSNMFVRQMHFKNSGDCEQGHEHNFDHLTLLASGKLRVEVGDSTTEYTAPCMVYIKKDVTHKLTALHENTVAYCIHGLRDKDKSDDILSPEMVPQGVELFKLMNEIRKK